jgi:hypothetical protein
LFPKIKTLNGSPMGLMALGQEKLGLILARKEKARNRPSRDN